MTGLNLKRFRFRRDPAAAQTSAGDNAELNMLRAKVAEYERFVKPGHFYSPMPDLAEFSRREADLYADNQPFAGIDTRDAEQVALLKTIAPLQADLPFTDDKHKSYRYYYRNDFYSYGDATIYACLLRHFCPRKVIEIGSGYSSALLLDMNMHFSELDMRCTFIEPFPNTLNKLLRQEDRESVTIHQQMLQDVDPQVFTTLGSGDFLFIDSTHVSKAGSDVNQLFFHVLPNLPQGCIVHIHDVFDPFEYPADWVREGRAWNELYLLRSFLQFNNAFEILYFNHYMARRHHAEVETHLPIAMRNPGGAIWLRKVT